MEFSGQECWNGLSSPSPGDLPDPGIEPTSPALHEDSLLILGGLNVITDMVPATCWHMVMKKPDQLLVMFTSVLKFAIEYNIPHNWLYLIMVLPPISLYHSALGPPLFSVFNSRGKKKHSVQAACYGLVASSPKNIYWSSKYFRTWLSLKMQPFTK